MKKIKKLGFSRAEEIINTANKNFKKYFKFDIDKIYFWISDEPYYIYFIDLNRLQPEVQTQHISYFITLLKKNNFINKSKIES